MVLTFFRGCLYGLGCEEGDDEEGENEAENQNAREVGPLPTKRHSQILDASKQKAFTEPGDNLSLRKRQWKEE